MSILRWATAPLRRRGGESTKQAARPLARAIALAALAALATPAFAAPRPPGAAVDQAEQVEQARTPALPVVLGEVTSNAASAHLSNITELLRDNVQAELSAIDWSKSKLRRRYKISASVVKLESAASSARSLTTSCTVSAALRDAERGTVLAIVEGKAKVEDAPAAIAAAERDALAGAVRGAISALPEAIMRAQ